MATNQSVVLETSMGDIQLELYWDHAPRVRIVYMSRLVLTDLTESTLTLCRHVTTSQNLQNVAIIMASSSTASYQ